MSIFRLDSNENHAINSKYIQTVDLTLQNLGNEEFDTLIQGMNPRGTTFIYLYHLHNASAPNSVITIPNIYTNYEPFSLLLVTNINTYTTTAITMHVRSNGNLVALFTQEDYLRIH
ncbi:hypothetical protein [Paenibacillus alginolyticus]|uniref:Uncharacterized protein n=1 Tax=Paenibacillus alginolyticus TaxID=59839 RepID=A0ABT4GDU7_9BACL|nr:hypothetical protein [Paenibacillus alginolyticus]MCY9694367.1 hypothetical protein [Paenibacillus alginolyticus]MEC0147536.1 hypothetical protein [Paenibacillus alginolyticus]